MELRDGDSAACLELAIDDRFGLWINGLLAAFGYRVILAEDRRNPALDQMSELFQAAIWRSDLYIELISIDASQFDGNRTLPRFKVVHITCSMASQVGMTILEARYLVLPIQTPALEHIPSLFIYISILGNHTPRINRQHPAQRVRLHLEVAMAGEQW